MELPKRKYPRLKNYDYSQPGYYYITVHVAPDGPCLSTVKRSHIPDLCQVHLTPAGTVIKNQLFALESRYKTVSIDRYVIMPTHIHTIIRLNDGPQTHESPTLTSVVGAFKSLATREWNGIMNTPGKKVFQSSFYETVLRNESAYVECCRYIDENPMKWLLYAEDDL